MPCLDQQVYESESNQLTSRLVTDWHEELDIILSALDDSQVECDGMTRAISYALTEVGINHQCYIGHVHETKGDQFVIPHVWIELPRGWLIDFRLRMWIGDTDEIPHGVFHASSAPNIVYTHTDVFNTHPVPRVVLDVMTDGRLSHIKIAKEFVLENPRALNN